MLVVVVVGIPYVLNWGYLVYVNDYSEIQSFVLVCIRMCTYVHLCMRELE